MFQGIAKKCAESLADRYNQLTIEDVELAYANRKKEHLVSTQLSQTGKSIQTVEAKGQVWYLDSLYDPSQAASAWAMQYARSEINDYSIFLVYGLGDGRAVSELMKLKPDCKIIVYEPCQEIFWEAITREEVLQILNAEQVCVIVEGICDEYYFHVLQNVLDYSNYQLVVHAVLPNYDRIFDIEYKNVLETYVNIVELIVFTRNTHMLRGVEIARNGYALIGDVIRQYSVTQLWNIVQKKGMGDLPAILVAAGPSLDKNVRDLKEAAGRAFLMVVDTALNTVLENGILPDMTMTIDSRKPLVLFKNELAGKIPVALSTHSNYEVVKKNTARHYYEIDAESYFNHIFCKITGKIGQQLPTGGSVANNALSLLIDMGFKTIILVGQDLAYPGGKEHTEAAYNSSADLIQPDKKTYIEVEDIYGNMVLTEENMNLYRVWIEKYIAGYKEVHVMDATEGGAKIAGTDICTLKEAIHRYCGKEYDISSLLPKEDTFFTREEQQKLKEKIRKLPDELELLKEVVEKGKNLYEQLDECNHQKKIEECKKIFKKITLMNEDINELEISILIQPYMTEESYGVEAEVYQYGEDDTVFEQINGIVRMGKKLLHGYTEGIEKFAGDMPLILENI